MFKEIISLSLIALMLFSFVAVYNAAPDDVQSNKLLFATTTAYSMNTKVYFYDANMNELKSLAVDFGHYTYAKEINLAPKINNGAKYMTIQMKPYATGVSWVNFNKIPIQAASFKFVGALGSSAGVQWKFADGSEGNAKF